jgi:hypothetical protein
MEREAELIGDWVKYFPNGIFRVTTKMFDDFDDNILEVISFLQVQDKNKFPDL